MPGNPRLTPEQLKAAARVLDEVRQRLVDAADGDPVHLWALRRKVAKELIYDERGHPSHRNRIKKIKRMQQRGLCAACGKPLPEKYCVLDRINAIDGYTVENTNLIHQSCDQEIQVSRGYS